MSTCPLCDLKRRTRWYHEDRTCRVVRSLDLDGAKMRLMVVPKEHGMGDRFMKTCCIRTLKEVANRLMREYGPYDIEVTMRSVKDHWHAHARFK